LARSYFEVENTSQIFARRHFQVEKTGEDSALGHFEVTWLEKARLEVTSRSKTLEKTWFEVSRELEILGSKSFRDRQNSAKLQNVCRRSRNCKRTRLEVISRSRPEHGENLTLLAIEATRLEKARLEVTSRSLGLRKLGSK
jgi:hypothetical protein